jgi:hypothetical protein
MEELVNYVNYQNYFLGCRVCRQLLVKSNSIFFQDQASCCFAFNQSKWKLIHYLSGQQIPDMEGLCYSDAFVECTNLEVRNNQITRKKIYFEKRFF